MRTSLLTVEDVAEKLVVKRDAVYEMAAAGVLPVVRVGRLVRFDPAAIERWIASGGSSYHRAIAQ